MKKLGLIVGLLMLVAFAWLFIPRKQDVADTSQILKQFKHGVVDFQKSIQVLSQKIVQIDTGTITIKETRQALTQCRLNYKCIAYFVEFYFPDQAFIINGPPVTEVERGMNEFQDPSGMQVIEACLFETNPTLFKNKMLEQTQVLQRSVQNLLPFIDDFKIDADDIWYALSLELIRVYTLYITGYDAPQLKTGITEAAESLSAIHRAASILDATYATSKKLPRAKNYLLSHTNFDSFDRLYFIMSFALPLQQEINAHVIKEPENVTGRSAVNLKSISLFAADAMNKHFFPGGDDASDSLLTALGKLLFSEPLLSGNNSRSCATCHGPESFFADRLRRNKNRELTGDLPRNTPSLLYAAYQFNQFWDGRVVSLEQQASAVLNDTMEMKGSGQEISEKLNADDLYKGLFQKIWKNDTVVTEAHMTSALAAYVRTLAPFHSAFDKYIAGDTSSLSLKQKRGFNVFMGKGLCGTCHFAPLFNGLLPPLYNVTEFEILGTPLTDNLLHPIADIDTGQARLNISMAHGAFKTPTVRNAAETSPYMHNGAFSSLETVIDFYDKGGGQGLGLPVPGQTLSPQPLQLDSNEKADLKAFLISLTDK